MEITIQPIVTEKANLVTEKSGRYSFRVSPDANKYQIKSLVEKLYDVKVVSVNTMNYSGKRKQRYTKSGLLQCKVSTFKNAVVTMAEGQNIDFYSKI